MNFFLSMMTALSIFGFRSEKTPGEILDKKIWEYSRILKTTNNLEISGLGRGFKDDKIAIIGADYKAVNIIQIEEARINIVKLTEFYLHKINSDPELQSLLPTDPLSIMNFRLGISYMQPNGTRSPSVAYSFTKEGSVFYCKFDEKQKMLVDLHKETYEEALAILNGKKTVSE